MALTEHYDTVDSLEECDVFINCKCDRFEQVFMLHRAAELGKRVINISSNAPDQTGTPMYSVYKGALDDLNSRLFYEGVDTTSIRFGYFDSERVAHIDARKMSIDYCVSVIDWVLAQPHRVKELTVVPE